MIGTLLRPLGFAAIALDSATETLSGARTWSHTTDGNTGILDCGGASRTLTLEAEATVKNGLFFFRNVSDGEELLSIVDDAAGAITAILPGGWTWLKCNGTTWDIVLANTGHSLWAKSRTLSGTLTLTTADARVQVLDPGGAGRNVVLPAEASMAGAGPFIIVNAADAAETLTVQDNDGSTTVLTIAQNFGAKFYSTGAGWVAFRFAQT